MIEMLQYAFMQKALVTGIVISIACSLLGVFLILRRYSLLGHGLSHVAFCGIAIGILLGLDPFLIALVFAIIGALAILHLKSKTDLHEDTSIGIISEASLGTGIFIASLAKGFNVDLFSYLFGNILAITLAEMYMTLVLAIAVIAVIILFYNELFFLCFDQQSARTSGIKVKYLDALLIVLSAITVVSSMRVIGILLVSSFIIIPASTALLFTVSFKRTLVFATLISMTSVIAGLTLSYQYDFATSGTIVLLNFVFFFVVSFWKRV